MHDVYFYNLPPEVKVVLVSRYNGNVNPFTFNSKFKFSAAFSKELDQFVKTWTPDWKDRIDSDDEIERNLDGFISLPFYFAFDGEQLHLNITAHDWPLQYKFGGRAFIGMSKLEKPATYDGYYSAARKILESELSTISSIFNEYLFQILIRNDDELFEHLSWDVKNLLCFDDAIEKVKSLYGKEPHIVLIRQ